MTQYKLKTPKAVEKNVVGTYNAIRDGVVNTYETIENSVVGTYKKVEEKFVDTFLQEVAPKDAPVDADASDTPLK